MTPKDAFGVVVRTLGALCLFFGGYALLSALYVTLFPNQPHLVALGWAVFCGVVFVLGGLYLLRGAPFAYPHSEPSNAAEAKPRIAWDADC